MPKLSIIIPVYNVEDYLKKCLDSIINQTYKNLEIIIINDASSDNSQKIINEYKNKDNRIISITNKTNQGLGQTRNIGIRISSGQYLTFVDSDDWLELKMYEEMINLMGKNNVDVVECNFIATNNKNSLYIKSLIPEFNKNNLSIDKYINHLNKKELGVVVWNKIYRASIIKENNINFVNDKEIFGEDLLFNLELAYYIKSIKTTNKPLYNFFIREGSITNNKNSFSLAKIERVTNYFIKNNLKHATFKNDYKNFSYIMFPIIKFSIINSIKTESDKTQHIKILKSTIKNKLIFKFLKINLLSNKLLTIKEKLFCLLLLTKMFRIILTAIKVINNIKKI